MPREISTKEVSFFTILSRGSNVRTALQDSIIPAGIESVNTHSTYGFRARTNQTSQNLKETDQRLDYFLLSTNLYHCGEMVK